MLSILNSFLPAGFYTPAFTANTIITAKGADGKRSDLPRFPGDTRFATYGKTPFRITGIDYGNFSSQRPGAEFVHNSFGIPHYEVEVLGTNRVCDNYSGHSLVAMSRLHIDAKLADENLFERAIIASRRAA